MRDEEEIQRALGVLRKWDVSITSGNSQMFYPRVVVEALNETDAIAKAKIHFMMQSIGTRKWLDEAEYEVELHVDDE